MAKPKSLEKAKEVSKKQIQAVYFRMDRTSTYAWQPYRLTVYTDGSIVEDIPFKEDIIGITVRKMADEMKESGNAHYERVKAKRIKDEAAAEKAGRELRA